VRLVNSDWTSVYVLAIDADKAKVMTLNGVPRELEINGMNELVFIIPRLSQRRRCGVCN